MIKKFCLIVAWWMLALCVMTAQAQDTKDDGSAVKLGNGATIKNTIIWGNKGKPLDGPTPINCYIQAVGLASPQFVDSISYDFRLKTASPCRDMGADAFDLFNAASLDLWGNPRINGKIDIGANEYKTYQIKFLKEDAVLVEQTINGVIYDSLNVEPGGTYKFKLDYSSIEGISAEDVSVVRIDGNKPLDYDADFVYTLENINSNIIIRVTLTPPLMVTVTPSPYGKLKVTGESGFISPDGTAGEKTSLRVEKDHFVTVDTLPLDGYYCKDVWMQAKTGDPKVSIKNKLNQTDALKITENKLLTAEFSPYEYPVVLKVNDPVMGQLSVKNKKTGEVITLPVGDTEFRKKILYDPDLSFEITATAATGYELKSLKLQYKTSTTDITNAAEKKADMRVGGVTVVAEFEAKSCKVSWLCVNGNLTVTGTGMQTGPDMADGSKVVSVPYNTLISITPVGGTGFQYQAGSLKKKPTATGSTAVAIPGTGPVFTVTVTEDISLSAIFELIKYQITVASDPTGLADFWTWSLTGTPASPVTIEHGNSITLTPKAPNGYRCSEIWVNGVKQANNTSVALVNMQENKAVKFVFERQAYTVVFTNATPQYGTLSVRVQHPGGTVTEELTGGSATVHYEDKILVTTTAKDVHHKLSLLKITKASTGDVDYTIAGTYTEASIQENLTINAGFEPENYTVTLEKLTGTGLYPEKGKIQLTDQGGRVWVEVPTGTPYVKTAQVPYGTRLSMTAVCDANYALTALDTLSGGHSGTILAKRGFTVTGDVVVNAEITSGIQQYHVKWTVDQRAGDGNTLDVYKTVAGDVTNNGLEDVNTVLLIQPHAATNCMLLSLKDQNGNTITSPYTLVGDLEVTAKFVRKCQVKIVEPANAAITVKDGAGRIINHDDYVAVGTVLKVEMKASTTDPSKVVGCKLLKVEGVDLPIGGTALWTGTISRTVAPPGTSGVCQYTIPLNSDGGVITFSGESGIYYKIKYAAANYGTLEVTAGTDHLSAGTQYWYPSGDPVKIVARETAEGYQFNEDHSVVNHALTPLESIILTQSAGTTDSFEKLLNLTKHLDLTTTFDIRKYPVTVELDLPDGVTTLANAGTIEVTRGTPVLYDAGQTWVNHNDYLNFKVNPNVGYAFQIKLGEDIRVSGITLTEKPTPLLTAPVTYTIKFIKRYKVYFGANIAKVVCADATEVHSGDWVTEGTKLTAYSVLPLAGKECVSVEVKSHTLTTVYTGSSTALADGTIAYEFDMPGDDVDIDAQFDKLKYDLACRLTAPTGVGTVQVLKLDGGTETSVAVGNDVLSYGDMLKVSISLPVAPSGGATDSWYEVNSMVARMSGTDYPYLATSSGLKREYTFTIPVSGDVDITALVERRLGNIVIRVKPANTGFQVKVKIGTAVAQEYASGYQVIQAPVGETIATSVQVTAAAPEGYEQNYYPAVGQKLTDYNTVMPLTGDLSLSAEFVLKEFPLTIRTFPADGGTVNMVDGTGTNYSNTGGKYKVKYGSSLNAITVTPASDYYRFVSITGYMGNVDQLNGQTSPYHIDKVVDSVGIEARLQRLYKVIQDPTIHGTLQVQDDKGVSAEGKYYASGQLFTVQVQPADPSYTCSSVGINFRNSALPIQTLVPDATGRVTYTIPDGLDATDLVFFANFEKKRFKVTLVREPIDGGDAEVWNGDKLTGTQLLSLQRGDPDTETSLTTVEYGSVLNFYTMPNTPDFEELSKVTGTTVPYTGPVTVYSDTTFRVEFGRLYTLTFGLDIQVIRTDINQPVITGNKIPAGLELTFKAQQPGHNCTKVVAEKDGVAVPPFMTWTDTDHDGLIGETFTMPEGDLDMVASFEPKQFKVKVIQLPSALAFDVLDVTVTPNTPGESNFVVDTVNGSMVKFLSSLSLTNLILHPWFEEPVTVVATINGDPTAYDLRGGVLTVRDSVTIVASARRKQKVLTIDMQAEAGANGNQVIVQTEDGEKHIFTADGTLTIDVGASVKVVTVAGEGCKTTLLSADDGVSTPVVNDPFELNLANMPDKNVKVTVNFALKRYRVYYTAGEGGNITVKKTFNGVPEGNIVNSGDEVKHFTELEIIAIPLNQSYQLKANGLTTKMGGGVVTDPERIASVTADVNIEAEFERIYEIRTVTPNPKWGTLEVSRADTNAVGHRYPAVTALKVKAQPETGYEITSLKMNGVAQAIIPEGGEIICTIPGIDPDVDSVEFRVDYALKKYKVIFIAGGEGQMEVDGLAGGTKIIEKANVVNSDIPHFTELDLSVTPNSDRYLVSKFVIYLPDGTLLPVVGMDTTIMITGNTNVEVEFRKYYWIVYDQPEHGTLNVKESDTLVVPGARYPGLTAFDVRPVPDEGYELKVLTANGSGIVNNTLLLPAEDAAYDTVRMQAEFKIKRHILTVIQPDSGRISVEKLNDDGNWVALDVTDPVTLDYWTQIRMSVEVFNLGGYEVTDLTVNGNSHKQLIPWVIKGDAEVRAKIEPRFYKVEYVHPQYGQLRVETADGQIIETGTEVPYRTELTVTAIPDDPDAYSVTYVFANGGLMENGTVHTVLRDVTLSAKIDIHRWEIRTSYTGEGSLSLYLPEGTAIASPVDSVEHYKILKVSPVPAAGWMLYSLDIFGADLAADSTIMVTQDIQVTAVFKEREPYLFPVIFTPNGDGYNDAWVVSGLWQAPENTLEIYNRDQQRIYKASPYMNEWEGTTDNGKELPAGTYVYKFTVAPGEVYMGLVSIIRN